MHSNELYTVVGFIDSKSFAAFRHAHGEFRVGEVYKVFKKLICIKVPYHRTHFILILMFACSKVASPLNNRSSG